MKGWRIGLARPKASFGGGGACCSPDSELRELGAALRHALAQSVGLPLAIGWASAFRDAEDPAGFDGQGQHGQQTAAVPEGSTGASAASPHGARLGPRPQPLPGSAGKPNTPTRPGWAQGEAPEQNRTEPRPLSPSNS